MAVGTEPTRVVDNEHLFVLQYPQSEQMFGKGDAMSVACELEYEEFYPSLRLVADAPGHPVPPRSVRRRRIVLAVVTGALLVGLTLPLRALGGQTIARPTPVAGQVYVVQQGDTLSSIAAKADPTDPVAMTQRLVAEVGSDVVVPGEHVYVP
jgi:hypothetical protein